MIRRFGRVKVGPDDNVRSQPAPKTGAVRNGPGGDAYHARMHGYFDVQREFGVIDETASSTLLRPVLVR